MLGQGLFHGFAITPLSRSAAKPLLSDKMTSYRFKQAFGRIFAVESLNNLNRKICYDEYLDNFHWIYDPELDRKHGIKIEV